MKQIILIALIFGLTACQHTFVSSQKKNVDAAKTATLNDASHLCQKELQGNVSFKQVNDEIKLYCTFTNQSGNVVSEDAVAVLQEFAKGMIKGDTAKMD